MNITESIKFNKLKEENEKLKKELAEKDKEINKILMICNNYGEEFEPKSENIDVIIKNHIENLEKLIDCLNNIINGKNKQLQQSQLFKGDFEKRFIDIGCFPRPLRYVLKDNSKYDTLPSKEGE